MRCFLRASKTRTPSAHKLNLSRYGRVSAIAKLCSNMKTSLHTSNKNSLKYIPWITPIAVFLFAGSVTAQDIVWEQTYPGTQQFHAVTQISMASDGDILAVGEAGVNKYNPQLSRLSPSGDLRWTFETGVDEPYMFAVGALEVAPDRFQLIATRGLNSTRLSPRVPYLVNVNGMGDSVSSHSDLTTENYMSRGSGVVLPVEEGYRGIDAIPGVHPVVVTLRHLSSDGSFQRKVDIETFEEIASLRISEAVAQSDGALVFAGDYGGTADNSSHIMTVTKIDADGGVIWDKRFPLGESTVPSAMIQARNGDILLACEAKLENSDTSYAAVLRLDADGELIWQKLYGSKLRQTIHAIAETGESSIVLLGEERTNARISDGMLIHVDSAGEILWQDSHGNAGVDDTFTSVYALDNGNFLIGGLADDTRMYLAEWDIASATSVDRIDPTDKLDVEINPHPVEGHAAIDFKLEDASRVNIELFDGSGRLVRSIDKGLLEAGAHNFELDVRSLAFGTYYYQVSAGSQRSKGRFVKL